MANLYGWTGGVKGSKEAARTDDLISIVRMQFSVMPKGPKALCGDFNGSLDAFPNIQLMLNEEGWTDVGNDPKLCGGKPGRFTCHANAEAKESRVDYIVTNDRLTPAVVSHTVHDTADFPTHWPVSIEIETQRLEAETDQLQNPTTSPN